MPNPLKVLLLTPQTPYPPDQGAAIRNFSFVRYLGGDPRYQLTLLSFARPGEDSTTSPTRTELEKYCRQVVLVPHPPARSKITRLKTLLTSLQPDLAHRLASPQFETALARLLAELQPDVVQCEGLEMMPFVLDMLEENKGGGKPMTLPWIGTGVPWINTETKAVPSDNSKPRFVLDEHNAEFLLQRRIFENDWQAGGKRLPAAAYSWLQARRLGDMERRALAAFDRVITVSEPDRLALQHFKAHKTGLAVIPNGLDLEEFTPAPDNQEEQPDTLVFTGTMDFRPNVDAVTWFAREVWPLIKKEKPQARFTIVGRRPAPAVEALKAVAGIEVTGEVSDARPYIRRSQLYVVPMRMGGGVRYKVLEALAMAKPVVTTTLGADGIALQPGHDALLADSPAEFAQTVLALLDDPARGQELARNGRAFVEKHFDWRKIVPQLDKVLLS